MSKNILFSILTCFVILVSCSKKSETARPDPIQNEKIFPIKFNVSGFQTKINPIMGVALSGQSNTTNSSLNHIKVLECLIYNSNGSLVKSIRQDSTNTSLGVINEELPSGDYRVCIIGSSAPIKVVNSSTLSSATAYIASNVGQQTLMGDWFLKSFDLKVSDKALIHDVTINRIVGKFTINISDEVPAKVSIIEVTYSTGGNNVHLNTGSTYDRDTDAIYRIIKPSDLGSNRVTISRFVLIPLVGSIAGDVTFKVYDISSKLIVEKTVKNIKIEVNKETTLTGNLFSDTQNTSISGFKIAADHTWGGKNEINF